MQVSLQGSFKVQELEVRFKPRRKHDPVYVKNPEDAYQVVRPLLERQPRELLLVLALSEANEVIGLEVVAQGTANYAPACPREIFKAPLLTNATAILVAHNHPSGNLSPSDEDRNTAKAIARAGKILDIKLLDFIIAGPDYFQSFAQSSTEYELLKGGD